MKFTFVEEFKEGFIPNKWAILGMSPNSDFIKFLRGNNKNSFSMEVKNEFLNENEFRTNLIFNSDLENMTRIYYKKYTDLKEWELIGGFHINDY